MHFVCQCLIIIFLLVEVRSFSPLLTLKWSRLKRTENLSSAAKGDGHDDRDSQDEVNSLYNGNKRISSIPTVDSRKNLFGTLQLPQDSIDKALRSNIPDDAMLLLHDMNGLEADIPVAP